MGDAGRRRAGVVCRTPDPPGAIDDGTGAAWCDFGLGDGFGVEDARESIEIEGLCLRLVEPGSFARVTTTPEDSVGRITDHVRAPRGTPTKTRVSVFSS
jgi:hypothetical protein